MCCNNTDDGTGCKCCDGSHCGCCATFCGIEECLCFRGPEEILVIVIFMIFFGVFYLIYLLVMWCINKCKEKKLERDIETGVDNPMADVPNLAQVTAVDEQPKRF